MTTDNRTLSTSLSESLTALIMMAGPSYWLIAMFKMGNMLLFIAGMIPFCWPFTGLIGYYAMVCGWPAWVHSLH